MGQLFTIATLANIAKVWCHISQSTVYDTTVSGNKMYENGTWPREIAARRSPRRTNLTESVRNHTVGSFPTIIKRPARRTSVVRIPVESFGWWRIHAKHVITDNTYPRSVRRLYRANRMPGTIREISFYEYHRYLASTCISSYACCAENKNMFWLHFLCQSWPWMFDQVFKFC